LNWRNELDVRNVWTSIPDREWGQYWQGWDAAGRPWVENKAPQARHAAFLLRMNFAEGVAAARMDPSESGPLLYLLLNTEDEDKAFNLHALPPPWRWERIVDTSLTPPEDISPVGEAGPLRFVDRYAVALRSSVLLRTVRNVSEPDASG
jgi:hypothetical protein